MNYRKLYAKHYGIKIPPEYDIHHIDFDRNNNNIENLLLLPKKLHRKLHHVRNTSCVNLDRFFDFQGIAAQRPMDYERRCINAALDVYDELQIWSCRKYCEDIGCVGWHYPYDESRLKTECVNFFDYTMFRIKK